LSFFCKMASRFTSFTKLLNFCLPFNATNLSLEFGVEETLIYVNWYVFGSML
jgi:hypothetical protein